MNSLSGYDTVERALDYVSFISPAESRFLLGPSALRIVARPFSSQRSLGALGRSRQLLRGALDLRLKEFSAALTDFVEPNPGNELP